MLALLYVFITISAIITASCFAFGAISLGAVWLAITFIAGEITYQIDEMSQK